MRLKRLLLLLIAAAAVAGVVVPSASALAFEDQPCIVQTGGSIKICPQGSTGKAYSLQITGRDGTGCVPFVSYSLLGSALPPGLSMSSSGWGQTRSGPSSSGIRRTICSWRGAPGCGRSPSRTERRTRRR